MIARTIAALFTLTLAAGVTQAQAAPDAGTQGNKRS